MRPALLLVALLLGACTPASDPAPSCGLAGTRPMTVATLYFGREQPDGSIVSDAAWQAFADDMLATGFPDGSTVFDAAGQWYDPAHRQAVREPTKVVVVAVPAADDRLRDRLDGVIGAYKSRFRQESVGLVLSPACATF